MQRAADGAPRLPRHAVENTRQADAAGGAARQDDGLERVEHDDEENGDAGGGLENSHPCSSFAVIVISALSKRDTGQFFSADAAAV